MRRTMEFITTEVLHKAYTRGMVDHGWLRSKHTFSFGNYFNPERLHFGALKVLNDDEVAPGKGFTKHPHSNMEIISIPLQGNLVHCDSLGNTSIIKKGDVQIMSAGTGILHSEFNASQSEDVRFLQIWIEPNEEGVEPRYGQITLDPKDRKNRLQQIVSPDPKDDGIWIHQNAWLQMTRLEKGHTLYYKLNDPMNNGVYAFVIDGQVLINNEHLVNRDGYGVWDVDELQIAAEEQVELLLIEVPMMDCEFNR